jgi:hypothetical protein
MGTGDKVDRSKTQALRAGSLAVIQPKANHCSWTNEETIVQVHGIGPLVMPYVNPADDPRNKNKQSTSRVAARTPNSPEQAFPLEQRQTPNV